MNFFSLTSEQAAAEFSSRFGKSRLHAFAVYRDLFSRGKRSAMAVVELADDPLFAQLLDREMRNPSIRIVEQQCDEGVCKFASTLSDGAIIESVIIPSAGRTTLCISSQVGCKMGCAFCATGSMGFVRNLSTDEIVWQLFAARFIIARQVDNIVFMGMGEPLDNLDNVAQAVRVFSDQRGFNIPQSRITISTAGHVDGLAALARLNMRHLNLALSLNAANDTLRTQLMPINKRYPLNQLKAALKSYPLKKRGLFFIEYVLLGNVNDAKKNADEVIDFVTGLPVRVNLIAYNNGSGDLRYAPPSPEIVQQFRDWLDEAEVFVRVRRSKGQKIMAACGQLSTRLHN